MTLSFSQTINGKPTHFIARIWEGFFREDPQPFNCDLLHNLYGDQHIFAFGQDWEIPDYRFEKGKIHTLRDDLKKRWRRGVMIDYVINNRQTTRFVFAPKLPVISIQEVAIEWRGERVVFVTIDKNCYCCVLTHDRKSVEKCDKMIELLAHQDGFDTVPDFFAYFNESKKLRLIHWTKFRY